MEARPIILHEGVMMWNYNYETGHIARNPVLGIPYQVGLNLVCSAAQTTVKPVLSGHSKKTQKLVSKTDYRLMQVKSIAECS